MEIGQQIIRYRKQQALSQEKLAEKVYVSRQSISNWENDKTYPDIHSLLLLSQIFQVSLDQLIKMKWRKKMALEVTDATFVEETKEGLVLIDFWATWCGPCRMQAPILEQLSQEIDEDELKILKMDVDENPETARQFGIMSIPTLMFKKDGEVVKQVAGVHTKDQLKAIIAELS